MPTTPKFGLRYPALADPPNGPTQLGQLAADVEAAMSLSFADYNSATDQSVNSGTTTLLAFGTAVRTSSVVSRATSGTGHVFTLNRAGLWTVSVSLRVNQGGSVAYTGLNLNKGGAPIAIDASTTNGIAVLGLCAPEPFAAGETVSVSLYHERGSAVTVPTSAAQGYARIRLAWVGQL